MKGDITAVYGEISFESHTSSFVTARILWGIYSVHSEF